MDSYFCSFGGIFELSLIASIPKITYICTKSVTDASVGYSKKCIANVDKLEV
jgi:hypothetical protein